MVDELARPRRHWVVPGESNLAAALRRLACVAAAAATLTVGAGCETAVCAGSDLSCSAAALAVYPQTAGQTTTPSTVIYMFNAGLSLGSMGGRAGSQATCAAARAGLTFPDNNCTTVQSFVSITAADQIADYATIYAVPASKPVQGPTGVQLSSNYAGLLDGGIDDFLQNAGVLPAASTWWSFSSSTGVFDGGNNCSNGIAGAGGGVIGASNVLAAGWMQDSNFSCAISQHILCICY